MVYLKPGGVLRCWARLDAYWREGRRQLLVEDLELEGGLKALPGLGIEPSRVGRMNPSILALVVTRGLAGGEGAGRFWHKEISRAPSTSQTKCAAQQGKVC